MRVNALTLHWVVRAERWMVVEQHHCSGDHDTRQELFVLVVLLLTALLLSGPLRNRKKGVVQRNFTG